jgi:hypothetical protein
MLEQRRNRMDASGEGRNRTGDTTVFSRVLYRLSYLAQSRSVALKKVCLSADWGQVLHFAFGSVTPPA